MKFVIINYNAILGDIIKMKNHIKVNGQLLQTNKKWSSLKEKQKNWIREVTAKEHAAYVGKHKKIPKSKYKKDIIDKVYEHINNRNIWIPYREMYSHVSTMIDKLNRKTPFSKNNAENPISEDNNMTSKNISADIKHDDEIIVKCDYCKKDMNISNGCKERQIIRGNKKYKQIKVGDKGDFYENEENAVCGDCGAKYKNYHHLGCDLERCPACKGQLISCICGYEREDELFTMYDY